MARKGGKTALGRIFHDIGATALKAVVQPFKSFSNVEKYDKIFNPTMQTSVGKVTGAVVDKLDNLGHSVGKAYTQSVSGGIVNFDSGKAKVDLSKILAVSKTSQPSETPIATTSSQQSEAQFSTKDTTQNFPVPFGTYGQQSENSSLVLSEPSQEEDYYKNSKFIQNLKRII